MDSLAAYLTESFGWSLLGLLIGFLLGRTTRDVHHIARTVNDSHESGPSVNETPPGPTNRHWWSGQFVLGVIVVLLGILTVSPGYFQAQETTRLQQCQARNSNAFADALDARSDATTDSKTAVDELITTIGAHLGPNTLADQQAIEQAVQDYLQKRRTAQQVRAQHPYPPPPRDACR